MQERGFDWRSILDGLVLWNKNKTSGMQRLEGRREFTAFLKLRAPVKAALRDDIEVMMTIALTFLFSNHPYLEL